MSDLADRILKVLVKHRMVGSPLTDSTFHVSAEERAVVDDLTRDILLALREPTETSIESGARSISDSMGEGYADDPVEPYGRPRWKQHYHRSKYAFNAMIDAALSEK